MKSDEDIQAEGGGDVRLIDADALLVKQASIAKMFARSDAQKSLMGRVMYNTERAPTIDAIPVEWLCEKIREEDRYGGIPFGEYLKVLIYEWHQQDNEEQETR